MHGHHSLQSLKRLFRRYNELYFDNQLPECTIVLGPVFGGMLQHASGRVNVGAIQLARLEITIDLDKHRDGEDVRATLLHEMIHLQASGHGKDFWFEVDRVLGLGATSMLVDVASDDAEDLADILRSAPSGFQYVRRALKRRVRAIRYYGVGPIGPLRVAALLGTTDGAHSSPQCPC